MVESMRDKDKELFFSVVIPTYNRPDRILKAVRSVLEQDYENFEVLVCDDGSIEDIGKIVSSFKDSRVKFLRQENKGCAAARNLGIKNAKGNVIAFLDDDDKWLPDHLGSLFEFFRLYPEAGLGYTQKDIVGKDGKIVDAGSYKRIEIPFEEKKEGFRLYEGLVFDIYLKCTGLNAPSCTAVRKDVFDKVGLFDEGIYNGQDYEMWLRITNQFRIGVVRKVTVRYLVHKNSISGSVSRKRHVEDKIRTFESVLSNCDLDDGQKIYVDEKLAVLKEELDG